MKLGRQKATLVVRNLESTLVPYFEIEKSGRGSNIAISAGVSFQSKVDKQGVVSPGTRKNLDLDLSVSQDKAGGALGTGSKRADGQVDVVVRGDVRAGVKMDTAAIVSIAGQEPKGLRRLFKRRSKISATYLDTRNRVTYTVSGTPCHSHARRVHRGANGQRAKGGEAQDTSHHRSAQEGKSSKPRPHKGAHEEEPLKRKETPGTGPASLQQQSLPRRPRWSLQTQRR